MPPYTTFDYNSTFCRISFDLGGPDERFGIVVMVNNVLMNGGGEGRDADKDTAAQTLGGNVAKEALDHVQPGCRSGCEVNMENAGVSPAIL